MLTNISKDSQKLPDLVYKVYTDGSCDNKDTEGVAGMGSVVVLNDDILTENSEVGIGLSSNAAEMRAALRGIQSIIGEFPMYKGTKIMIYSDSTYVVNTINIWMDKWKKDNFLVNYFGELQPRPNSDDVALIYELSTQCEIKAEWVKGHAGDSLNEHAHNLAFDARKDYLEEYG